MRLIELNKTVTCVVLCSFMLVLMRLVKFQDHNSVWKIKLKLYFLDELLLTLSS